MFFENLTKIIQEQIIRYFDNIKFSPIKNFENIDTTLIVL